MKVLVVGARSTDKGRVYVNYIIGNQATAANERGLQFPKVRNVATPQGTVLDLFVGLPNVYEVEQELVEGRDGPFVVLNSIKSASSSGAQPVPVSAANGSAAPVGAGR